MRKPKLTLTRHKEPEFETSQKEMMAKIPKFKARPLNKKILQTATSPPIPRSKPQPPEFKEFPLETLARAHQNAYTASIASTMVCHKSGNYTTFCSQECGCLRCFASRSAASALVEVGTPAACVSFVFFLLYPNGASSSSSPVSVGITSSLASHCLLRFVLPSSTSPRSAS
ncbi:hypothetical protein VNO78_30439 [Psophocarpus tetragonolobus]|uniref:TPX2 central domain-containing protein n=1 Tax=Psophocarpus tetragonolobus TaxID=3891 RepID=A0AAN9RXC6_PSOTE